MTSKKKTARKLECDSECPPHAHVHREPQGPTKIEHVQTSDDGFPGYDVEVAPTADPIEAAVHDLAPEEVIPANEPLRDSIAREAKREGQKARRKQIAADVAKAQAKPAKKAKAAKAAKAATTAKAEGLTLQGAADAYLASMEAAGNSESTRSSYKNDLGIAISTLGDVLLEGLTPAQLEAFATSDPVMRKASGKEKAEPTWKKTRRVLRLALQYAHDALGFTGPKADQLLVAANAAL